MRVLKIVPLEWGRHTRNIRELNIYREMGAEIVIIDKGEIGSFFLHRKSDGFDIYDITTRPLGKKIPNAINRTASIFVWAHYVKKINPDVIDGHNLISMIIGYLPYLFKQKGKKPLFIYDAHEYELSLHQNQSIFVRKTIAYLEKFIINHSAFSMVVNDGIADAIVKDYHLKNRPVVIRSTPDYWNLDSQKIKTIREEYCRKLCISSDSFIVEYHGYLIPYRGIEEIFSAMSINKAIYLVIIGDTQDSHYQEKLDKMMEELNIKKRVLRYSAMPIDELKNYVAAADCGLVMNNADNPNYIYALPNKLFENIQAENPIICSDLIEIRRIVDKYNVGMLVPYGKPEEIVKAFKEIANNNKMYETFKTNVKIAKKDLCWEKEQKILKKAFYKYIIKKDIK